MTLDSLALGVLMPSFRGPALPSEWARLLAEGLGGVCLFGSNLTGTIAETRALTDAVRRARPDALVAVDEEGGDVTRLHADNGSPVLGAAQLGAIDDLELTAAAGRAVAADLVAAGIDLDLGPVADVSSNPDNPVIGTRSFGSDPALVGRHVAAWTGALQAGGVAACVKHFPGHGATAQDSHVTLPVLDASVAELRVRELPPFRAAVEAGAAAVMTSHIVVPAVDADLPATFSRPVLSLLRDDLGHDGAVVSDALDMAGASAGRGIPAAAVLALAAGVDLLCLGPDKDASLVRAVRSAIVDAVRAGRLVEERLADAVRRVEGVRRSRGLETVARATSSTNGGGATSSTNGGGATSSTNGGRAASSTNGGGAGGAMVVAAHSALVVEGELPDLSGAQVLTIDTPANIAVGEVPWGISPDIVVAPGDPLPAGRLVVQVRDAHRHPEVGAMLAVLPDGALVVEWGWPGARTGWEHRGTARICTRGCSRPMVAAVEEIVRGAGWSR